MEIQLQELIEQIKKDGVQAAEAQAEAITRAETTASASSRGCTARKATRSRTGAAETIQT